MKRDTENLLKELNPYEGIIGIGPDLKPRGGFDQNLERVWNDSPEHLMEEDLPEWKAQQMSAEDRCRLADHMIELWSSYRHSIEDASWLWDEGYDSAQQQIASLKQQMAKQSENYKTEVLALRETLGRQSLAESAEDAEALAYWEAVAKSVEALSSAIAACPENAISSRMPLKQALARLVEAMAQRGQFMGEW